MRARGVARWGLTGLLIGVCLGAGLELQARGSSPQSAPAPAPVAAAGAVDEDAPVAVPPASDLAMQRYRSGNVLWIVDQIWSFVIPAAFLFTGLSARLQRWPTRLGRRWFFIVGI